MGTGIYLHLRTGANVAKKAATGRALLEFVWSYPQVGEAEECWAVKESLVLTGDLVGARKEPGLGVAIVTTELAQVAFRDHAIDRIKGVVAWAMARAERAPPYRMLAVLGRGTEHEETRLDRRHTFALGIVLARSQLLPDHVREYVKFAAEDQEPDGGWPTESLTTVSRLFTAIYAIEFLNLAVAGKALSSELASQAQRARAQGILWMIRERRQNGGLWSSAVMRNFAWDGAFATAWVLHRLANTVGQADGEWRDCLDEAAFGMVQAALDPRTWEGTPEIQRMRVEAKIAAAAQRASRVPTLSSRSRDAIAIYLSTWRARPRKALSMDLMDVSTAAFLVETLVSRVDVPALAASILRARAKAPR